MIIVKLTDEQERALKDGETVEILLQDRDGAADALEIDLYTRGVIGPWPMEEVYPELYKQEPVVDEYDTGDP